MQRGGLPENLGNGWKMKESSVYPALGGTTLHDFIFILYLSDNCGFKMRCRSCKQSAVKTQTMENYAPCLDQKKIVEKTLK